jgi:hypothetical protein
MRYILLIPFCFIQVTIAGELTIFDVRKPIALSDKEVVQKDYYIDSGSEAGLQKGLIVTVIRKVPLYDTYQSRSAGDLKVEVAKVRIISAQQGLAVARFAADIPRADIPILEDNFIMVGDHLDMSTATRDKKSASNDEAPAPAADPGPAPAPAAPSATPAPPAPVAPAPTPAAVVVPPPPAEVTSQKIEVPAPKEADLKPNS